MPSKRPAIFLGDAKKRLRQMPEPVRKDIGVALDIAQHGEKPNAAKPLRGFGGAGVLEIFDDYDGDTYRGVHSEAGTCGLCASRLSKEKQDRI